MEHYSEGSSLIPVAALDYQEYVAVNWLPDSDYEHDVDDALNDGDALGDFL